MVVQRKILLPHPASSAQRVFQEWLSMRPVPLAVSSNLRDGITVLTSSSYFTVSSKHYFYFGCRYSVHVFTLSDGDKLSLLNECSRHDCRVGN